MAIVRKSLSELRASRPSVNRALIAATDEAAIRRQMGEDGHDPDEETPAFAPAPSAHDLRKRLGMTQEAFASALRIPVATIRNWEQGRTMPDPAVRALLTIVASDPASAFKALETPR